jgi:Tfp pilus assembly protein PilW
VLTALRARLRRTAEGDHGISLMEMVVAMALATILGAATLYLFVSVDSSTAATNDRTINTANARNTLEAWTSYLQVSDGTVPGNAANRFEWLTPSDMLFYADINNRNNASGPASAPTLMWLRRDSAGHLIEEQFASSAVAGSSAQICRRLGESVTAGTASTPALFTPTSSTGASLGSNDLGTAPSAGSGCQPLPTTPPSALGTSDPVAVANLRTVSSVEIAFTVTDTSRKHSIEFDSVVTLPSLGASS